MNLLIDGRIRNEEYNYLSKFFNVEKLELSNDVYSEISGHSDIFYCKINDKIICSPNAKFIDKSFIVGDLPVGEKYPEDVKYNVCQIGDVLVANKYIDKKILDNWNNKIIKVNQGYTKCSISCIGNKSYITSDKGIYTNLKSNNINIYFSEEKNIHLLDKDNNISKMQGFIGGATLFFDNKFVVFGDIRKLSMKTQELIKKLTEINNIELVDFPNLEVIDYGGGIIYK